MWGVLKIRVMYKRLDGHFIRCTSTKHESFGLENIKAPPVPDIVRKPPRLPFLKSIYANQFDIGVLTYPETLNLERHKDLESRIQQVQHKCTQIDIVRQLGLFGMSAPYPNSGLNLSDTEIVRVFEHFNCSTFKIVRDHTLCVDIIKIFGTPSQKSKYLPLLASGAICSLHNNTAVNAKLLSNQKWELNGSVKDSTKNVFSLFVIENNAYIVENDKSFCNGENLELKQVVISPDDTIENINLSNIMLKSKLYTCSLLVSSLKKVLQSTIMSILPKSRLEIKLREYDSVHKILGKTLLNVYTIESMIYLTTWMTDGFDNPDVELETAVIQLFIRQTIKTTLQELQFINGRNSIKEPFLTLCNDVEDLMESLDGKIKLANFISIRGVEYSGNSKYDENISFIVSTYRKIMMKKNNPSLKYEIQQFLHPALKVMLFNGSCIDCKLIPRQFYFQYSADFCEHCILKFQYIIDQYRAAGQLNTDNEMLMQRLSTVITYIYAMTAVLGRASRSYCTGIRFSDYEVMFLYHIFFSFLIYYYYYYYF